MEGLANQCGAFPLLPIYEQLKCCEARQARLCFFFWGGEGGGMFSMQLSPTLRCAEVMATTSAINRTPS